MLQTYYANVDINFMTLSVWHFQRFRDSLEQLCGETSAFGTINPSSPKAVSSVLLFVGIRILVP